jgi:hypothetical protein
MASNPFFTALKEYSQRPVSEAPFRVDGELARKLLWTSTTFISTRQLANSYLLMVNGRSTPSSVSHLFPALRELCETSARQKSTKLPRAIDPELIDVTFASNAG